MLPSFINKYGEQVYWVGPNYWPAHAGIRMWSDWRPDLVANDLKKMADLGFTVNRSFLFMPDFVPTDRCVEPVMLERFQEFLHLCDTEDIQTIPSFFVGHMSGEDWDVQWRQGKNFYTDETLRDIQKMYVQTVIRAAADYGSIAGWIATNEIFNYEPHGSADEIAAWGRSIADWIREIDREKPISLGDGARGPETNRRLMNFQTRKYISFIDFIGLHFYPRTGNPWHQSFTTAYRVNISQFWNKPVIVEEFGHSTTMGSEENQADYYRVVLYSALMNGAAGTLNWCFSDFDLYKARPYSHHPFELRFGLVKTSGEQRPAAKVMSEFSKQATELVSPEWQKVISPEIAVLIPSNYYYQYPHDYDTQFDHWYPLYLEVFSQLKRTNLQPRLLLEPAIELENNGHLSHELNLDPEQHPVLVLPRLKRITAVFWQKIIQYVVSGGTLYASFAQDHWIPDWEEIFGINSDLKFGIPAERNWEKLIVKPLKEWGIFSKKSQFELTITKKDNKLDFAYCPIISTSGEVLMADQDKHPVLIKKNHGKGQIYFSAYPLEMISLCNPDFNAEYLLQSLYKSLWLVHNTDSKTYCDGQDLECGIWHNSNSDRLKVMVLNHADDDRSGRLTLPYMPALDQLPSSVIIKSQNEIEFFLGAKDVLIMDLNTMGKNESPSTVEYDRALRG
jgi:endo-1,4-beta-mannosidase